jgi:ArsR family transcriptional regulator
MTGGRKHEQQALLRLLRKMLLTRTLGRFTICATMGDDMTGKQKAIIEAKANVLKALGHPTRLWMAEQLENGEKCVCELAEFIDADFSTISKHLSVLKQAGVVTDEKRGKQVYYKLKVPCILKYMSCVEAVIKAQAEERAVIL